MENTENKSEIHEKYNILREGKASILFSKDKEVFYNPVQEVNRDLSIIMIKLFQEELKKEKEASKLLKKKNQQKEVQLYDKDFTILEALSATGLRSIRYAKEIEGITRIIANDIDAAAVEAIQRNIQFNNIEEGKIIPNHSDASIFMWQHRDPEKRFSVVDIDPYGGADPFLDAAVQAVDDGGLLCVTCTDMAVLCGNHPETAFTKYGSIPLHAKYCHEQALRIVLMSIQSHASRYKRYIVPLLSLQIDFYVRIFVRVYTSPSEVKKSASNLSFIHQCSGCDSFWTQPLCKVVETKNGNAKVLPAVLALDSNKCPSCTHSIKIGGPLWTKSMHNPDWLNRAINHIKEFPGAYNQAKMITGILHAAKDELHDVPLYYNLSSLTNTLHTTTPSMVQFKSVLLRKGYKVSNAHCDPAAFKTNAPNEMVWDVLRCWAKLHPPKQQSATSPSAIILGKPPSFEDDFTIHKDAIPKEKVPKFHPNPQPNWGPGSRAKGGSKKRSGPETVKEEGKKSKTELKESLEE